MRPGHYLSLRRQAAGFGLEDAQAAFDRLVAHRDLCGRVRSIESIEADDDDLTLAEVLLLSDTFDFDVAVLFMLISDAEFAAGVICRVCGCSWDDPCDPPCGWSEGGTTSDTTALCTNCAEQAA